MIVGNSDHDPAAGRICSPSPDSSICGEGFIWSVLVPDTLEMAVVARVLDALLGHSDGCRERGVDARVGCKLCWKRVPTSWASHFALSHPLFQAGKTEVLLAWSLQGKDAWCGKDQLKLWYS